MSVPAYSSFAQCYCEGRQPSDVRTGKLPGRILDLLEQADLPITAIARETESSSNQVLARDRTVRDPVRPSILPRAHSALGGRQ